MLNAPARRAGHERNRQILMGREEGTSSKNKSSGWENETGKGGYIQNRPTGVDICIVKLNLEKQVHKLAMMT